ncbi:MAG TPA: class I SAM-dependent methyltransferase [Stellaceae bacterium]|nr:class I SAM-dependent methyltransferase [Stellaceae bacterium]
MLADLSSIFTRMAPYSFTGEQVSCALCGGDGHEIVGKRDRYGHRLTTVLCRGCGLVFTNPMPTQDEIDLYYRRHYRRHYHNAGAPRKKALRRAADGARARRALLYRMLVPDCRVLDVGSAEGAFVGLLHREAIDAVGIEPNEGFADAARRRFGARFITTGWEHADFAAESFDLITAHHVLEHFRDPIGALSRFRSWLKPDGRLYISVPDSPNPMRTPYARFHFAHLYNFNHQSLVMAARKAGFEIEPSFAVHSTTLLFRKLALPPTDWLLFPDNYSTLTRFFREHTNLKYFLSSRPYGRWVRRMARLGRGMIEAQFAASSEAKPKGSG